MLRLEAFGHATVGLTATDGGWRLLIDPYAPGGFGGRMAYPPIALEPDVIVVSHRHGDHSHTAPFPSAHVLDLEGLHGDARRAASWPDATRVWAERLGLSALQTWHDAFDGATRGGATWMSRVVADGVCVVHAGDLGALPEQDVLDTWLGDAGCVDVLLVPCGGFYTIGAAEAAELALRLRARVVVPMHVKTAWCDLPGLDPVDAFLAHMDRVVEPGERVWRCDAETLAGWPYGAALVLERLAR